MLMSKFTGSMADVPKDLLAEIKKLEDQFTVGSAKLKQITKHFVSELEKGLSVEGGSIVSSRLICIFQVRIANMLRSQ